MSKQAQDKTLPFKLMMVDGRDWIIINPKRCAPFAGPSIAAMREDFKEFHGRKPSRSAKLFIVPPSYSLGDGMMSVTMKRDEFAPVEVR